ncbi:MAG: hypothetical protein EHM20_11145 [Alphaproteobacteria bacterium]|nr:MAG: hypothetical protein EHM20_11145 [Alphaproteobacteria bacterium]
MEIKNKIGLEAEIILRDYSGKVRFPGKHGFGHDEFFLLGEFRAKPGETRNETVGNFMDALSEVFYRAREKKFQVDFSGLTEISPEMKADITRKMLTKRIPECSNIYGTDILKLSDDVVENGVIKTCRLSAGLHVHFSRWAYHTWMEDKTRKESWKDIITPSQMQNIITQMDKNILPRYNLGVPLKYRNPGFYEKKSYGFEYRSLPMVKDFTEIDAVLDLVDFSFSLLEKLDK